jgi:hypothetical protein
MRLRVWRPTFAAREPWAPVGARRSAAWIGRRRRSRRQARRGSWPRVRSPRRRCRKCAGPVDGTEARRCLRAGVCRPRADRAGETSADHGFGDAGSVCQFGNGPRPRVRTARSNDMQGPLNGPECVGLGASLGDEVDRQRCDIREKGANRVGSGVAAEALRSPHGLNAVLGEQPEGAAGGGPAGLVGSARRRRRRLPGTGGWRPCRGSALCRRADGTPFP